LKAPTAWFRIRVESFQQEGQMSSASQWARKISVLGVGVLSLAATAPGTLAAVQEKDTIDNRVVMLEAFVVETDEPLLSASVDSITKAAQGDLSDLFVSQVPKARSLRDRLVAAEEKGLLRILAAPVFLGESGEELNFSSGAQVPVATIANNTVTTRYVNAALELRATARVESRMIRLYVQLERGYPRWELLTEDVLPTGPAGSNVPLNTQSIETIATVRDGGKAVFGGVYELRRLDGKTQRGPETIFFITARAVTL
jgi:Flp pilus assembly secretin CpaC